MRCDQVERLLSSAMDEPLARPLPEAVRAHAETCTRCRAFEQGAWRIRKTTRLQVAPPVPDLAPAIMERIAAEGARGRAVRRGRRRLRRELGTWGLAVREHPLRRALALGLAAGVLIGFVLSDGLSPPSGPGTAALAAEIPDRLVAAAQGLRGYVATYDIVERNWAPAVPLRTFVAHLAFRAPEDFRVRVHDTTPYPAGAWIRNDLTLVTNGRAWMATGTAPCPDGVAPPCPQGPPVVQRAVHRPPFDQSTDMPTDVIVPMTVLAAAHRVDVLGSGEVGGRRAVAVGLSYQDATPLFASLQFLGAWRPFFPQDRVVVWLDRSTWFPLSYEVFPAAGPERARWAGQVGVGREGPGRPVFRATIRRGFSTTAPPRSRFSPRRAAIPSSAGRPSVLDEGFVPTHMASLDAPGAAPVPRFTAGLSPFRSGELPRTALRPYRETLTAYANGLAWLTVARVSAWHESRPFGVGSFAQPMTLPGDEPALYEPATSASARRLALHTIEGEILVSTNLPLEELRRVAASLPVRPLDEPERWRVHEWAGGRVEDGLAPSAALRKAGFPALVPSWLPPGYRGAVAQVVRTARVRGVTIVFRRPAAELDGVGLRLYQARGQTLPPPTGDEQAVSVRGVAGRWSAGDHELEWVSGGVYRSLTAPAFELSTLLHVASSLEAQGGTT
jgi:Putative zinc-finger